MIYDISIGIVLIVLGAYLFFNYRSLFEAKQETLQEKLPEPELITDISGGPVEVIKEEQTKQLKAKKPSVKRASKKASKRKPRNQPRREL